MKAKIIKRCLSFIRRNKSAMLTGASVAGVLAVAVTSHKAGQEIIAIENEREPDILDYVKVYAAPTIAVVGTATAIIANHSINKKQIALLTASSATMTSKFGEFVNEIKKNGIETNEKRSWFYEPFTGAWFYIPYSDAVSALYNLNLHFQSDYYITYMTLHDFFTELETVGAIDLHGGGYINDELGWTRDYISEVTGLNPWIGCDFRKQTKDIRKCGYRENCDILDGEEYYVMSWDVEPIYNFDDYNLYDDCRRYEDNEHTLMDVR